MTPVAIARLILERITDAEEAATWVAVVLAESLSPSPTAPPRRMAA